MLYLIKLNIFLLFLSYYPYSLQASSIEEEMPQMHVFIIGQMDGGNIGASYDYPRMQIEVERIASLVGFKLNLYPYKKEELSATFLTNKIKSLQCGPDDVIWFYYTGHGYNATNGIGNFPGFRIGDTNFSLEWVHRELESKKARLVICMFDCCNYEATNIEYDDSVILSSPIEKNYIALFGEASGSIKMASNKSGYKKYSYGTSELGGLFTSAFIESLDSISQGDYNECTWANLSKRIQEQCSKYAIGLGEIQVPYVELEVLR